MISYIKYLVYIAILNLYIFFPIFDLVDVIFHDSLKEENRLKDDLILIILKIYVKHRNMIKNSYERMDNYS